MMLIDYLYLACGSREGDFLGGELHFSVNLESDNNDQK